MLGLLAATGAASPGAAAAAAPEEPSSGMLSVKAFGAIGDNKADDTAAINRALATPGRRIFVPSGTYRVSRIAPPVCDGIVGEGEHRSIFAVQEGSGLSLAGHCKVHRDYQVRGNKSASATGVHFGASASGAFTVENLRVAEFEGLDAIGIRYDRCLKSVFINLTAENNTVNELWHGEDPAYPTSLVYIGGVNTGARLEGGIIRSGAAITIIGRDFESSGREGLLFAPGGVGHIEGVVLDGCWFEDNWKRSPVQIIRPGTGYAQGDRLTVEGGACSEPMTLVVDGVDGSGGLTSLQIASPGSYSRFPQMPLSLAGRRGRGASVTPCFHLRLDGTDANRKVWPSIRSCRFSMDTNTARAIMASGAGCNPTITDEWLAAVLFPSIVLQNGAAATFPAASTRYDYANVVSDEANRVSWSLADWRDYAPVLSADSGRASIAASTPSMGHCRYQRRGRTLRVSGTLSGTIEGNPGSLALTLPDGIRAARQGEYPLRLQVAGRRGSGGLITHPGTNILTLMKDGDERWTSGAFTASFDIDIEIN